MIKQLVLLPVAPLRFTVWVAGKVGEQADHEHYSPGALARRLREIEQAHTRGDLDDEQVAELEAQVIADAGGGALDRG
jgi:hypothetical protein